MRISYRHEITCRFERPPSSILRMLRVTPWAIDCQHLDTWRIDVDCDCRLRHGDDSYGNVVDTVSSEDALPSMTIIAQGEIVTTDTHGILRDALERFPPEFYLRETPLTAIDDAVRAFAEKATSATASPLDKLHALLSATCNEIEMDRNAAPDCTSAETFREAKGSPRDLAHVFITAARHIGAPARFVSGALVVQDYAELIDASHVWAEAFVPDIGWIGFDPTEGLCVHEGHVRVAFALDELGARPLRTAPVLGETITSKLIACEGCQIRNRQERSFGMSQEQFQS